MRIEKLKLQGLEGPAKDWGIDYQVLKIKPELIDAVIGCCLSHQVIQ